MKGKKIIVAIIVILIMLLMAGVAFAYVYTSTDILKSDKEMFFKYFAELTAEDGFVDKRIKDFSEKKKDNSYENSGTITAKVEYPDEDVKNIIEKVNDLSINFSGKVDSVNQKVEQNIEVDYGNNVTLPINYRQDGNTIGLQPSKIIKKYISVKNENLKQLLTNLGVEDVSDVPDTIEISEVKQNIEFTDEEKEMLKQIYGNILEQNLLEENFSSVKTEQNVSYTLELSIDQIKNIIVKMLEATKENTLIIDKINEIMLEYDPEADKIDADSIDDIIKEINGENKPSYLADTPDMGDSILSDVKEDETSDTVDIPNLKLTLIQTNKELKQITIQSGKKIISIEKNKATDSLNYNIECEATEEVKESTDNLLEEAPTTPGQFKAYLNIQLKGLETLSSVQENYIFGFNMAEDEVKMKYDYEINTDTIFTTDVSIEALDETNAIILNNYEGTDIKNFLQQLVTRVAELNKNQMTELGLKEHENPLLYTNPVTMLGMMVYNMANESINNVDFSAMEISAFNDKFIQYEGENVRASEVNAMMKTVLNSNMQSTMEGLNPTEGKKFVSISGNAGIVLNVEDNAIDYVDDMSKLYNIKIEYDDTTGFVSNIIVDVQE